MVGRIVCDPLDLLPSADVVCGEVRAFRSRRATTHRWRVWLAAYEWWIVGAIALGAFAVGYVGIAITCRAGGSAPTEACNILGRDLLTNSDVFYLTAQLYIWQSGALFLGPQVHWLLDVARFAAPLVLGYAAIRGLLALFVEQLHRVRAVLSRNHVIIAGTGGDAASLAHGFRAAGWRVVIIGAEGHSTGAPVHADTPVVIGHASDIHTLLAAGIRRARHLIAIGSDDVLNVEACARAMNVSGLQRDLTCHAHIGDLRLWESLRTREIAAARAEDTRLQFFSTTDVAARAVMSLLAGAVGDDGEHPAPHFLFAGWTAVTQRVLVHCGAWWHARAGASKPPLVVSVIAPDARERTRQLASRYLGLASSLELRPEDADPLFLALPSAPRNTPVTAACVIGDTDSAAIAISRRICEAAPAETFPLVVCARQGKGVGMLLSDLAPASTPNRVMVVRTTATGFGPELVLDSTNEVLARSIHDAYRSDRGLVSAAAAAHGDPALVPWSALNERLRESNRQQADHIIEKLDALGCAVVPQLDWQAPLISFTSDEIERLARWEHDRWMDERRAAGWRYGEQRSVEQKTSPSLVPWDRLSEPERAKNRNTVRRIPELLARVGVGIVRRGA